MELKIRNLWNIRHRVTGNPLSIYFLDVKPAANNSETHYIECLKYMRAKIQTLYQDQINIPQCERCHAHFHTKGHCALRPRYVKCSKSHRTEKCTTPKTQPATCLHCGESPPASYRGCKIYREITRTRFPSYRITASIQIY
jgi:hypothetical protein